MNDIRQIVRERYAEAARTMSDDATLGLGDPVSLAGPRPGETVLDLGSGPGLDMMAAARAVGPSGRVIGVDMTPEMLDRARTATAGLANVSLLEGDLEGLPLPCASVDAVISNCVINLVEDKLRALTEAYRVLVPGGRIAVLDTAFETEPPAGLRDDPKAWCACVGGSLVASEYVATLELIGFTDVQLTYTDAACGEGCDPSGARSVAVTARKPGHIDSRSAIRPAVPADRPAIDLLLAGAGLPSDGLRTEDAVVIVEDGAVTGTVAVERRGPAAILRSLVVQPEHRSRGTGARLAIAALEVARWSGAREVYLATMDANRWFERFGFAAVSRERAQRMCPSSNWTSAGCADAITMRLGFDDPSNPITPLRKALPTFQGGACC